MAPKPGDRIVILEDTDGDGRFDKRTVFYDKLNYVTGIEVGFGGVWVMSPPNFYFIPDRDGDDVPDGPPEVLLDGFGNHANAAQPGQRLCLGAGRLAVRHARPHQLVAARQAGHARRASAIRFDGGVYRYHPVRHVWEPYADGTTNPWGIDWDDYGEAFVSNCVNPHLFHVIQGAHYEPWRNRESSQYAYERIADDRRPPALRRRRRTSATGSARPTRTRPAAATPTAARWSTWATTGPSGTATRCS